MNFGSNKAAKIKIKNNTHLGFLQERSEGYMQVGWKSGSRGNAALAGRAKSGEKSQRRVFQEWRRSPASTEINVAPAEAE